MPATRLITALLLVFAPLTAPAAEAWTPARVTSPASVTELKSLQDRVTEVVAKVTPATVGLLTPGGRGMTGAGSGVIVSESGLVLTAAHVIGEQPGKPVQVVLADGTMVRGKTLGVNPDVDSGMVQITGDVPEGAKWPGAAEGKWPTAEVGKSKGLKPGQWLVALGHPGGPKKDRKPPVRVGRMLDYIEKESAVRTDCPLVGGDSGGPLFDLSGRVVGIHSRIGSLLDHNMHVATEFFKDEWADLARGLVTGQVGQAELGVTLTGDDEPTLKAVTPGGPAAAAGLKAGDVILGFDGEQIHSREDLIHLLGKAVPATDVEVEVRRGGGTKALTVTLGKKTVDR